jgi:hypothetical protein
MTSSTRFNDLLKLPQKYVQNLPWHINDYIHKQVLSHINIVTSRYLSI